MRYELIGMVPGDAPVKADDETINAEVVTEGEQTDRSKEHVVYRTDSETEARAIYGEGGFLRDGDWFVVTGIVDTTKPRVEQPPNQGEGTDIPVAPKTALEK